MTQGPETHSSIFLSASYFCFSLQVEDMAGFRDPQFSFNSRGKKECNIHVYTHTHTPIIFGRFRQHIGAMGCKGTLPAKEEGEHRHGSCGNYSEPEIDFFSLEASYSPEYIYISLRSIDTCHMVSQTASNLMAHEDFPSETLCSLMGHFDGW